MASNIPTVHPPEVWLSYRQIIIQLYLFESLPLEELCRTMRERHGFHASSRQYKTRLRRWNIRRNVKLSEKEFMVRKQAYRQEYLDKETTFELCGRQIEDRELEPQRIALRSQGAELHETGTTPQGITYFTPPQNSGSFLDSARSDSRDTSGLETGMTVEVEEAGEAEKDDDLDRFQAILSCGDFAVDFGPLGSWIDDME